MAFKIVRNNITKMNTDVIVNTANRNPIVGPGCDTAIYRAAGYQKLLDYRKEKIGTVEQGDAFVTPAFNLPAKYIIHAVSPLYHDCKHGEEEVLRNCYRKVLSLAKNLKVESIAFPLISSGGFGYPKEEAMRIAIDEIHAFLLEHSLDIYLVVFDPESTRLADQIDSQLDEYIDEHYVDEQIKREWDESSYKEGGMSLRMEAPLPMEGAILGSAPPLEIPERRSLRKEKVFNPEEEKDYLPDEDVEELEKKLDQRMTHLSDTFAEYLLYLIKSKGLKNSEVYKKALVDKKLFSKIKNNPDYHPKKSTALCLCVGAKLSMDESKDLLARAGYALSPCDKTDIIFAFFLEHKIYDMIALDIQLEERGLPCLIP